MFLKNLSKHNVVHHLKSFGKAAHKVFDGVNTGNKSFGKALNYVQQGYRDVKKAVLEEAHQLGLEPQAKLLFNGLEISPAGSFSREILHKSKHVNHELDDILSGVDKKLFSNPNSKINRFINS